MYSLYSMLILYLIEIMYVYCHMSDQVIGLFEMKDGNTVLFSTDIDGEIPCYLKIVFTFYTYQNL